MQSHEQNSLEQTKANHSNDRIHCINAPHISDQVATGSEEVHLTNKLISLLWEFKKRRLLAGIHRG
jgi:hypothetical protein